MKLGVTGHQNLPARAEELLHRRLQVLAHDAMNTTVICSLAAGADTLVAQTMIDAGAALHVVIPCKHYDLAFEDDAIRKNYRRLVARATSTEQLSFENCSEQAFLRAGIVVADSSDLLLAIWDGLPSRGLGGTGDVVDHARSTGTRVEIVWPSGVRR